LTASAEQSLVKETLKALTLVKSLGVMTALGVSNVSFGLPNRPLINKTFLTMAMQSGLNMPILNPSDAEMMNAVKAFGVLAGYDEGAEKYITDFADVQTSSPIQNTERTLADAVKKGLKNEAPALAMLELEKNAPLDVINNVLIPALADVGESFNTGKIYLPQLMASAEAAKNAFAVITEKMPAMTIEKGTVIVATVKGDVHDIGKNIVKTVLQSYGYSVIDLGKDVAPEKVVKAVEDQTPIAVGLSALMTTTVVSMKETVALLKAGGCKAKIFVGGAVLTNEIAKEIGADCYAKDALEFVKMLEEAQNKV
jgi:5-methyltetrahydrofolate--homocysteine methyltransferase